MTSNHIRVMVLVVAVILGVTVRFVWRGYKIAKSAPAAAYDEDSEKRPIKIFRPATVPTNTKIYSPPKESVVVKVTPIQTTESLLKHMGPAVIRILAND